MRQCELIQLIERTAPPHLAAPWDHSGLQIAAGREDISRLGVCLDPSPDSVRAALEAGADMILSHHPLLMRPAFFDRLDAAHAVARLLFSHDVPLYAAHTSLDANPHGPAAWLARELDLRDAVVLEPAAGGDGYGFGLCGALPRPLAAEEFLARLPFGRIILAGQDMPLNIARPAVCPGSGGSLLPAAVAAGADLLLTGDITYHIALTSPIAILDVGHFAPEEEMMRRFAALLARHASVPVSFIAARDPFRRLTLPDGAASGHAACFDDTRAGCATDRARARPE
jgi:dinuclear metal center YbgI/SA1388 family protein